MKFKTLADFSLVGDTALSLRFGHRSSVDLDLFSIKKIEHEGIVTELKTAFKEGYKAESKTVKWGIFCYLND